MGSGLQPTKPSQIEVVACDHDAITFRHTQPCSGRCFGNPGGILGIPGKQSWLGLPNSGAHHAEADVVRRGRAARPHGAGRSVVIPIRYPGKYIVVVVKSV